MMDQVINTNPWEVSRGESKQTQKAHVDKRILLAPYINLPIEGSRMMKKERLRQTTKAESKMELYCRVANHHKCQ